VSTGHAVKKVHRTPSGAALRRAAPFALLTFLLIHSPISYRKLPIDSLFRLMYKEQLFRGNPVSQTGDGTGILQSLQ
jgi:hypothetical protein